MSADNQPRLRRPVLLDNPNADRIRKVSALAGRPARRRTGEVLVEGPQAVREAVRFCGRDLIDVYISEDAAERYPELVAEAKKAIHWVHPMTAEVGRAISPDCQGIAAVVKDFRTDGLPKIDWDFVVVMAETQDPGNAGIYSCSRCGWCGRHHRMLGTVDISHRK